MKGVFCHCFLVYFCRSNINQMPACSNGPINGTALYMITFITGSGFTSTIFLNNSTLFVLCFPVFFRMTNFPDSVHVLDDFGIETIHNGRFRHVQILLNSSSSPATTIFNQTFLMNYTPHTFVDECERNSCIFAATSGDINLASTDAAD